MGVDRACAGGSALCTVTVATLMTVSDSISARSMDAVWVGVGWATYWGALHAVAASLMEHGGGRAVKTISGRPGEGSRTRAGRVVERVLYGRYRVRGCAANRCKAVEPCAHYGRGGATILRCNTVRQWNTSNRSNALLQRHATLNLGLRIGAA